MKLLITILVLFVVGVRHSEVWAEGKPVSRKVRISTLCLLDDKKTWTQEDVIGRIQVAGKGVANDLIVVPLTPFLSFREGFEKEDLAAFMKVSRTHGSYLVVAMLEEGADGRQFYTSVLLGRKGEVVGKYRKSHVLPDDKMASGDDLPVFQTDFGVLGLSLGTDFYFPEVYGVQRMKGAEILVWQHFPERFREHFQWVPLLKARALDSHAFLVTAMYADPRAYITNRYEMGMQGAAWGRSMVLNRVGTPVADTGYGDGVATTVIDLDRRKEDPYAPFNEGENIFFVNNLGDRQAFTPLAQKWERPALPKFKKRTARVAVGYFSPEEMWQDDRVPEVMLRVLDEAAKQQPDVVLLSEMSAKVYNETTQKVMNMVADRARRMKAYVIIGGLGDSSQVSVARIWNREGKLVFEEPIYWTKGFPEIKVFDTDFARIGVQTCGDLYTYEVARTLALKGAEMMFDPSQMWGADGFNNELLLRARAVDNGFWVACAHWNSSDPGLRSVVVDPYGYILAGSNFQREGVVVTDIDFEQKKVYYAGKKIEQPKRGESGISQYFTEDIPAQGAGWREMVFSRRRPELYGILPTSNEVIMKYRPEKGPWH